MPRASATFYTAISFLQECALSLSKGTPHTSTSSVRISGLSPGNCTRHRAVRLGRRRDANRWERPVIARIVTDPLH